MKSEIIGMVHVTSRSVREGEAVVTRTDSYKAKPSCGGQAGVWYCATCSYLCSNNMDRDAHGETPLGESLAHAFSWLCPDHGAEVA